MTEAEFTELIFTAATLQTQYAWDLISIVFAYVVAGHFIGASLTRVQFVALTAVYSAFTLGIGTGAVITLRQMESLGRRFLEQHPAEAATIIFPGANRMSIIPPILFFSAWLVSVWYVASTRRPDRSQTTSSDST